MSDKGPSKAALAAAKVFIEIDEQESGKPVVEKHREVIVRALASSFDTSFFLHILPFRLLKANEFVDGCRQINQLSERMLKLMEQMKKFTEDPGGKGLG